MTTSHSRLDTDNTFEVYKVLYKLAVQDPDMPGTRYHTVVFVATEPDGSGFIHHVTGDLVTGMTYQRKEGRRPDHSATFHSKEYLGQISKDNYPSDIDRILRSQPPPHQQKAFNTKTMKTEPIKADGTFYKPGEPRAPLIKCTEWTVNRAIPAIKAAGILH